MFSRRMVIHLTSQETRAITNAVRDND